MSDTRPATVAACRARDRKARSAARHICWVASSFQALSAHHTAAPAGSMLTSLVKRIEAIETRLQASPQSSGKEVQSEGVGTGLKVEKVERSEDAHLVATPPPHSAAAPLPVPWAWPVQPPSLGTVAAGSDEGQHGDSGEHNEHGISDQAVKEEAEHDEKTSKASGIIDVLEGMKDKSEVLPSDPCMTEVNNEQALDMTKQSLKDQKAADKKDMNNEKANKANASGIMEVLEGMRDKSEGMPRLSARQG